MRKFTGLVVSTKNKNTATVEVSRYLVHPLYEKRVKSTKRYSVHDLTGVGLGDKVEFAESRPYSATKRWIVTRVLTSAAESKKEGVAPRKSARNPRKSK